LPESPVKMFNKIKRAFSHSSGSFSSGTSQPSEKKGPEESTELSNDVDEDATKILDDKIKRTGTLKDTRKGRAKGPKNRRVPSKKRKPLFDRFLAKLNINKKEKSIKTDEVAKVVTEEDAKASEVLDVVEKTEVLVRVERAPPPRNRRRPQRHNRGNEQVSAKDTKDKVHTEDAIDSGVDFVLGANDANQITTEDEPKKKLVTKDETTAKRKILTPKTFSMDRETETDIKNKPKLPGKEKPHKERRGSNASQTKNSEDLMDDQTRHSTSDEEDIAKQDMYSNVASELNRKLTKKVKPPSEDAEIEIDTQNNQCKIIEKPKLPTSKKPKQEKHQIHVILEESESIDSTISLDEQISKPLHEEANSMDSHQKREKPKLPMNKKPSRSDPDINHEEISNSSDEEGSNKKMSNALASELQRKLTSRVKTHDQPSEKSAPGELKQKPKLPVKKKPNTKVSDEKARDQSIESSENETNIKVIDFEENGNEEVTKKIKVPSKNKTTNSLQSVAEVECSIEDKENNDKEMEAKDSKTKSKAQVKPILPIKKKPSKDIILEDSNQDDNNNNENNAINDNTESTEVKLRNSADNEAAAIDAMKSQSIKIKAPIKPPRTKKRSQSNSDITDDKKTTQRRTQSETNTPDMQISQNLEIKKLKSQVSIDKEMNYTLPQSGTDSSHGTSDDEDLNDLFDVFDQEFETQIKSLPPSRKTSVRSMPRSSTTSIGENFSDKVPIQNPLELALNELDKKIKLEQIANNNEDDLTEETTLNQEMTQIENEQESNEDFIPSNKTLLNPRENKEDVISNKSTNKTNENKKDSAKIHKQKFDLGEGDIIQNFQKFYKSQESKEKLDKSQENKESKNKLDKSQENKESKEKVDELPKTKVVDNSSPLNSGDTTALPQKINKPNTVIIPSDNSKNLSDTSKPTEKTAEVQSPTTLQGRQRPAKKPTPPGKKPQLAVRPRNLNNQRPVKETTKPPSSSLDIFELGSEPSFVNEKDPMARKSSEDKKAPTKQEEETKSSKKGEIVKKSTQSQSSVDSPGSSQMEETQLPIYSNFQRPRAESCTAAPSSPRVINRLQSVPPVTKLSSRSTPPPSRHRNTHPQIYYEMGGKSPKPTYIEPFQINLSGRERSDSLRSSSPRKKNEIKEKSEESEEDH